MALLIPTLSYSQKGLWRELKGKQIVEADWNCTTPEQYPKAKLERMVKAAAGKDRANGPGYWSDRAFAFDLNGDGKPEYFVPLYCGAVGNCRWGIFGADPARRLGFFSGQAIFVYRHRGQFPIIVTYTHEDCCTGSLRTLSFRRGRYVWRGDVHWIGSMSGDPVWKLPKVLDHARRACEGMDI